MSLLLRTSLVATLMLLTGCASNATRPGHACPPTQPLPMPPAELMKEIPSADYLQLLDDAKKDWLN